MLLIGGALVVALLVKTFLFQAFYIPSKSMDPTLKVHDRVLVNKLSYKLHDVHRGDIVVFEKPPNEVSDIKDLVKRVIGLPNETVEGRNGHVYVDGHPLPEKYLQPGITTSSFAERKIPGGSIWVMGDNRPDSQDSRFVRADPYLQHRRAGLRPHLAGHPPRLPLKLLCQEAT